MTDPIHNLSVGDAMKSITLQVRLTGTGRLRVRLWLCKQLIRLAALVGGFGGVKVIND